MGGKHRVETGRLARVGALAGTVLAVSTVAIVAYRLAGTGACDGTSTLTVAAAPDIAPAVRAAATRFTKDNRCTSIAVTIAEPADVAAAVADQAGRTVPGLGRAGGNVRVPQVWIPDATTWLQRLRSAGVESVPANGTTMASSPVVLAMPEPVARAAGWLDNRPTWGDLLKKVTTDARIRTGMVDPTRDAAGLSGLLALATAATNQGADAQAATVGAMRSLAAGRSTLRADLFNRFPRGADPSTLASGLGVAPLSESAVIAFDQGDPPVPVAAVYPDPAAPSLDFPYTVISGQPGSVTDQANRFGTALTGPEYESDLAKAGLRTAAGAAPNGFPGAPGVTADRRQPGPAAAPAAVDKAISAWNTITLPARLLAVIDISGSMATPVPTAGGATREQVTVEAARRGLGLFDDNWAVGLWVFSTNLDGGKDWREVTPIGPLSTQRVALLGGLSGIQPKPNGGTGLYDTTLAAYKAVQADWDPGRINSIVLMTDGQNEDPNGLTLDQLTTELGKIIDPKRPVQVVALGIGNEVSQAELNRIIKTTGGGVFIATDPTKIGEIFLKALSLRNPQ